MPILCKVVYRFSAIPMPFFTDIEKSIPEFIWKHKSPQIPKGISILDFKLCYRSILMKIACYQPKNRHEDQ
jgi:hypothetical protein